MIVRRSIFPEIRISVRLLLEFPGKWGRGYLLPRFLVMDDNLQYFINAHQHNRAVQQRDHLSYTREP